MTDRDRVLTRTTSETVFIPVQINLTPSQHAYLLKIKQFDGIARGPYIRSLLKRDMERGFGLSDFYTTMERTVTSTVKKKTVHRGQLEPRRVALNQELKNVLQARKKKLEPVASVK